MGESKNKPNQEQMLLSFISKMMADKGLKLSAMQEQQLKARLYDKLNEQIQQSFVRALPNDKLALLDKLLDDDLPDEVIEKFFAESGVDMQAAVARAMEDFRQAFLNEGKNANKIAGEVQKSGQENKAQEGQSAKKAAGGVANVDAQKQNVETKPTAMGGGSVRKIIPVNKEGGEA